MIQTPLVLIAEDQPHIQLALEHLVRAAGDVQVISVNESQMAVHIAIEQRPQLIILSEHIHPIDACIAARMIRDQWAEQHEGLIWLSAGRLSRLNQEAAIDAGFDKIITNPFDPILVTDEIRKAVGIPDPAPPRPNA